MVCGILVGNMRDWTATAHQPDGDVGDGDRLSPGQGTGEAGARRVVRGGSWYFSASYTRVSRRHGVGPAYRYGGMGFRLARSSQ